ncbi:MAG: DUF1566 domain-containing protein [Labilithrix sp.]|nr:DUF1566 domain-containing protein [Labilithrix sp.]MCW5813578.1 DUF1566 domain-containing protein [Labilithrix sp.]
MARSRLRRALFAFACVTPLLAACNAILGISDYDKAPCNGGEPCTRADGGPDVGPDAPDAGPDVVTVDATGTAPVSWIQFKMPNYPQVDGPNVNVASYSDQAGDAGGIVDDVSGLIWRAVDTAEKKPFSYADAEKHCEALTTAKWRLPTRIELITLLDFSGTNAAATSAARFSMEPETYWTSSAVRDLRLTPPPPAPVVTTKNWGVRFEPNITDVLVQPDTKSATARVICIQDR